MKARALAGIGAGCAALAAVALAASGASAAPSARAARAAVVPGAAPITSQQLALMPLPLASLDGRAGLQLTVDTDSGVTSNARSAADSIDPLDTAASVAAAGRITGYELAYASGGGTQLSSEVELYRDEATAAAALRKHVTDFLRLRGKEVAAGARLASVATWAPAGLGEGASGLEAVVAVDTLRLRGTVVAFRLGRLVASTAVVRDDTRSTRAVAERNAAALLARVRGVLDGSITGKPVAVPAAPASAPAAAGSAPPKGAPAILPAALALADLPLGASIASDSYKGADSDQLVELERDFGVSGIAVGGSRLLSLLNDVTLYRTAATARAFVASVTGVYPSPQADAILTKSLGSDPSFAGATFKVDRVRALTLADGGTVVTSSIRAKAGTFRAFFGYVRVGRVVTALVATGPAATTREADVVMLLGRAARRAAAVD